MLEPWHFGLAIVAIVVALGVEFRGWYERLLSGPTWAYSAAMLAMLVCLELFGVTDAAIPFVYFQF